MALFESHLKSSVSLISVLPNSWCSNDNDQDRQQPTDTAHGANALIQAHYEHCPQSRTIPRNRGTNVHDGIRLHCLHFCILLYNIIFCAAGLYLI